MTERGHDRDALQCRIKVKELRNAFRKAREANSHSGAAPATCCFYKELDAILGGNPTSTQSTAIGTSEPSATRQDKEEQSGSEGGKAQEDAPKSLDACSQELFSSQEEGSQLQRPVLGEGQTPEEIPGARPLADRFWSAARSAVPGQTGSLPLHPSYAVDRELPERLNRPSNGGLCQHREMTLSFEEAVNSSGLISGSPQSLATGTVLNSLWPYGAPALRLLLLQAEITKELKLLRAEITEPCVKQWGAVRGWAGGAVHGTAGAACVERSRAEPFMGQLVERSQAACGADQSEAL
ncbi:hypothetical protein UY3_03520 [Chelonia mydas]|uniref:Myb/SANT-like DNA-binding domain-containing protein n=1 Tax=Chelonia mydas TaxID=8469 RepID=M7BPV2_CHEMY|nr:hypothetical protein UY3_03520 [Chelonia mydas]